MDDYFKHIISQLTSEDMKVLGILLKEDATAAYKALRRSELLEAADLSEANFRKSLIKLQATYFIEVDGKAKESKLYLTVYGQQAQKNVG